MRTLETLGTLLAASGFLLLSFGGLFEGFLLGFISCLCLIPVLYKAKLFRLLGLQCFFFAVNINGLFNNWIF